MKKKEVTNTDIAELIDSLAIMTAKRFDGLENGVNRHEGILHTINRRLDGLEEDVRSVKNSLTLVLSTHD